MTLGVILSSISSCTPTLVTYDPLTVPTDPVAAAKLYERSCESGHARGCRDLGLAHLEGRGATKDPGRATELFRRGCELGDAESCSELALLLCEARGVTKDWSRTEALWERACEGGSATGCWNLGVSRADGTCAVKSVARALPPLEKACEAKLAGACRDLGSLLVSSDEIPRDTERGLGYLAIACGAGMADVCETAAAIAERDLGEDGVKVGQPLWERGCALDNGRLCQRLAVHLFEKPETKERALELVEKACRLKVEVACTDVQNLRIKGEIPPPAGWALVRAARYTRGSPDDERGRHADETRNEVIMLNHLYVKKTEVTWGEWKALMANSVSAKELERLTSRWMKCGDRCPAILSFNASLEYLNALSKREGLEPCYTFYKGEPSQKGGCRGYRVPSEVEWERFARGGKSGMSWLGVHTETLDRGSPELDTTAVYGRETFVNKSLQRCIESDRRMTEGVCGPLPVASKAANPFGLHDVLGNVWEWTWDAYHTTTDKLVKDPETEVLRPGPGPVTYRAVRGCGWNSQPHQCRVANRAYANHRSADAGFFVGLRPVRTIGQAK